MKLATATTINLILLLTNNNGGVDAVSAEITGGGIIPRNLDENSFSFEDSPMSFTMYAAASEGGENDNDDDQCAESDAMFTGEYINIKLVYGDTTKPGFCKEQTITLSDGSTSTLYQYFEFRCFPIDESLPDAIYYLSMSSYDGCYNSAGGNIALGYYDWSEIDHDDVDTCSPFTSITFPESDPGIDMIVNGLKYNSTTVYVKYDSNITSDETYKLYRDFLFENSCVADGPGQGPKPFAYEFFNSLFYVEGDAQVDELDGVVIAAEEDDTAVEEFVEDLVSNITDIVSDVVENVTMVLSDILDGLDGAIISNWNDTMNDYKDVTSCLSDVVALFVDNPNLLTVDEAYYASYMYQEQQKSDSGGSSTEIVLSYAEDAYKAYESACIAIDGAVWHKQDGQFTCPDGSNTLLITTEMYGHCFPSSDECQSVEAMDQEMNAEIMAGLDKLGISCTATVTKEGDGMAESSHNDDTSDASSNAATLMFGMGVVVVAIAGFALL